jgi:hypothetical protein
MNQQELIEQIIIKIKETPIEEAVDFTAEENDFLLDAIEKNGYALLNSSKLNN